MRAFGERLRPVKHPDRLAKRGNAGLEQNVGGQILVDERQERVQMGIDDSANHLEGKSFGCRINREDFSAFHIRVVFAQLDVLSRLELAAVEKPH